MNTASAGMEPALRVLALLRGVFKVSLNLDLGYLSSGSAVLRRARSRARSMFPAGNGRWCARVMRTRRETCVRSWTRVAQETRASGGPVACRCHAGLSQYSLPVRRRGRMVGMVLALQVPRPASAGGFDEAWRKVRGLPGTRREWRADFDRLPALPADRMRVILELARDVTEAVLEMAATPADTRPGLPADMLARAGRLALPEAVAAGRAAGETPAGDDLVARARAWVEGHPDRRGGRAEIARDLGVTPGSLSRRFKRETGASLPVWVNRARVDRARALLTGSAYSIAEIATRTGFGTRRQFLNVFRRATGASPRAWRRSHWEARRDGV